jgi:hypothetical protein
VDLVSDVKAGWTAQELVGAAEAAGLKATRRLITDWSTNGLLDRPTRRGLGRGKGTLATWSDDQRNLLLVLLKQRASTNALTQLFNVPVGLWLYWDDLVPLRQARRALGSWVGATVPERSWHRARRSARQLVEQLDLPPGTTGIQDELVEVLAQAAHTGQLDPAALEASLAPLDQAPRSRQNGERIRPSCGDVLARISAHFCAIQHLDELPDELYAWARIAHRTVLTEYLQEHPILDEASPTVLLSAQPEWSYLINRACLDLLTILGLRLTAPAFTHLNKVST